MQPRRSLRLAAGALVLALPLLASCGFDKATNSLYTPAEGTNERTGNVQVLSAVVVSGQPESGTFIATMTAGSDDTDEPITFEGLTGAGDSSDLTIEEFDPLDVPVRDFVNLADGLGVPVGGDFTPGDFLSLTLSFSSGQTTTMDIPVVFACDEWAGLDTSAGGAEEAEEAEDETPAAEVTPSGGPTPTTDPEESASALPSAENDPYDCTSVLEEE